MPRKKTTRDESGHPDLDYLKSLYVVVRGRLRKLEHDAFKRVQSAYDFREDEQKRTIIGLIEREFAARGWPLPDGWAPSGKK